MTGPLGNSEFCFPSTSMLSVSEKQNSLFPLWPVIKCLLLYSWSFSRYSASFHWLVHGHMTSNNETVCRETKFTVPLGTSH